MPSIRTVVFAVASVLAFTTASGPAGSGVGAGCGATISIKDPQLRAMFADLDRNRTNEFSQICALARNSLSR